MSNRCENFRHDLAISSFGSYMNELSFFELSASLAVEIEPIFQNRFLTLGQILCYLKERLAKHRVTEKLFWMTLDLWL